jgi:hypothetical protein
MPRIDPYTFLDRLAAHLATTLSLAFASTPRVLWVGPADEGQVPPDAQGRVGTYTEARPYDGSIDHAGLTTAAVQFRTVGHVEAEVRARAAAIANALLDAQGRPIRRLQLGDLRLLGVLNLRGPSLVGRDDVGRPEWVVNADCQYVTTLNPTP